MSTLPVVTFGALLRRARLAAGLSQEDLAERAHLSREAISTLERGTRRAPRQETIALLADALQLAPEERARLEAAARGRLAPVTTSPESVPAVEDTTRPAPAEAAPYPSSTSNLNRQRFLAKVQCAGHFRHQLGK